MHVVFFGDNTTNWIPLQKIKAPFAEFLEQYGKHEKVKEAVEAAQQYLAEGPAAKRAKASPPAAGVGAVGADVANTVDSPLALGNLFYLALPGCSPI